MLGVLRSARLLPHQGSSYATLQRLQAAAFATDTLSHDPLRPAQEIPLSHDPLRPSHEGQAPRRIDEFDPPPSSSKTPMEEAYSGPPKLVVFGGRGFVGSHICQEALSTGLHVVGISRSGTPPMRRESWVEQVEWVRGNALEPDTYSQHLQGAEAVISAIGSFGSAAEMIKTNGTANVRAVEAAQQAGVKRFVYISAHIPNLPGLDYVLQGYINGKRMAEEAVRQHFHDSGVILRPSIIYGSRQISSSVSLPLQYMFQPLEMALSFVPTKQLSQVPVVGAVAVPPVSVQAVARAAVRAATDSSIPAGIMDVWEIAKYK